MTSRAHDDSERQVDAGPRLEHAAESDRGLLRPHNEDAHAEHPELGLFVVADGMGGHEAGEVASRIVVDHVSEAIRGGAELSDAASGAHRAVMKAVRAGSGHEGMGATLVAALVDGDRFRVAWAGDSRAYLFGGALHRITRDHSVVQELVDMGALTEREARNHPDRSLITRAMGMPEAEEMPVDLTQGRLRPAEMLLLCTDGLTEEVEEPEIERILTEAPDVASAAARLVEAALDAGGRDNVTVVLIRTEGAPERRSRATRLLLAAAAGLGAALVVGTALSLAGLGPFG